MESKIEIRYVVTLSVVSLHRTPSVSGSEGRAFIHFSLRLRAFVRAFLRAFVRAFVRARVRAQLCICMCVCVRVCARVFSLALFCYVYDETHYLHSGQA